MGFWSLAHDYPFMTMAAVVIVTYLVCQSAVYIVQLLTEKK